MVQVRILPIIEILLQDLKQEGYFVVEDCTWQRGKFDREANLIECWRVKLAYSTKFAPSLGVMQVFPAFDTLTFETRKPLG